jgi:hypothetical protein
VPVLVAAIRRETGCSRATAYRAVSDAFAADVLVPHHPGSWPARSVPLRVY